MTPYPLGPLAMLILAAGPLVAQAAQPAGPADAVMTISASDVARRIGIIAHDSMLGRDTPSRGLELTAQYVADQFRRFGLVPGGERGTWLQRYPRCAQVSWILRVGHRIPVPSPRLAGRGLG
jgi:hypothetical protein